MNSEQYEIILNSIEVGVLCLNSKGETLFANPKALEMIGLKADEIFGKDLHKIIHHTKSDGKPYPVDECPICLALKNGDVSNVKDEVFWRKNGSFFSVEYVSAPVKDKQGVAQGAVVVFKDVSKARVAEEKLRRKNIALEELLVKLKNNEREMMKNIELNIAKNVMPLIERMRGQYRIEESDLNELEESIRGIGSGFNRNLMLLKGSLSDQEMKVCRLVCNGNQEKEIAARMNVSLETVKTYKKRIRKKLNLSSRSSTLKKALSQYA